MIKPDLLKKLDLFLDQYYEQSKNAGKCLSNCFPGKGGKSQIRNLENIVYTARRISAVQNFIKNQMGKDSKDNRTWTKPLSTGNKSMGDFLLCQVEQLIEMAKNLSENNPELGLESVLYLARIWGKQVTSEYLYLTAQGGTDG